MSDRPPGPGDVDPQIEGLSDFERIGSGGYGVVYRAHQGKLNRDVAVKVLVVAGLDEKIRRRFDREARIMGALSTHPAIVTLYDSGFTATGLPYLVMELMAGGSIAERVRTEGPLGWQEASEVMIRVCDAVQRAHDAGVLHRDIKPDNILISEYGEVKLTDFGIAGLQEGTATTTSAFTGTVEQAAPEVLSGQKPTPAADIYSLASTWFTLIAGHSPFRRDTDESVLAVLARVAIEPVPDMSSYGVPGNVEAVLKRALAKEPEARFDTAVAFADALDSASPSPAPQGEVDTGSAPTDTDSDTAPPTVADIDRSAATEPHLTAERLPPRKPPEPMPPPEQFAASGQPTSLPPEDLPPSSPPSRPLPSPPGRRRLGGALVATFVTAAIGAVVIANLGSDDENPRPTTTAPATTTTQQEQTTTSATTTTEPEDPTGGLTAGSAALLAQFEALALPEGTLRVLARRADGFSEQSTVDDLSGGTCAVDLDPEQYPDLPYPANSHTYSALLESGFLGGRLNSVGPRDSVTESLGELASGSCLTIATTFAPVAEEMDALAASDDRFVVFELTGLDLAYWNGVHTYGDDPVLDALYDECGRGNGEACDQLEDQAQIGSEYWDYAATCGGAFETPVSECAGKLG